MLDLQKLLNDPQVREHPSPLAVPLGRADGGAPAMHDFAAGASLMLVKPWESCLYTLLAALLRRYEPEALRLVLIDAQKPDCDAAESPFDGLDGLPHLLCPVIRETQAAKRFFKWAIMESAERRAERKLREAEGGGDQSRNLPRIMVVVNKVEGLMHEGIGSRVALDYLRALASMGDVGIHAAFAFATSDYKFLRHFSGVNGFMAYKPATSAETLLLPMDSDAPALSFTPLELPKESMEALAQEIRRMVRLERDAYGDDQGLREIARQNASRPEPGPSKREDPDFMPNLSDKLRMLLLINVALNQRQVDYMLLTIALKIDAPETIRLIIMLEKQGLKLREGPLTPQLLIDAVSVYDRILADVEENHRHSVPPELLESFR